MSDSSSSTSNSSSEENGFCIVKRSIQCGKYNSNSKYKSLSNRQASRFSSGITPKKNPNLPQLRLSAITATVRSF